MLTKTQTREIQALKRMRDDEIDIADIRPLQNWNEAEVGKFYRPIKKSLTIRIDADVLAWLRGRGRGYQTRINALLRDAMGRSEPNLIRQTALRSVGPNRHVVSQKLRRNNLRLEYCEYGKWAALLSRGPVTYRQWKGGLSDR